MKKLVIGVRNLPARATYSCGTCSMCDVSLLRNRGRSPNTQTFLIHGMCRATPRSACWISKSSWLLWRKKNSASKILFLYGAHGFPSPLTLNSRPHDSLEPITSCPLILFNSADCCWSAVWYWSLVIMWSSCLPFNHLAQLSHFLKAAIQTRKFGTFAAGLWY